MKLDVVNSGWVRILELSIEVGSGSDVGQVTEPAGRAGVYPLGWMEGFVVHSCCLEIDLNTADVLSIWMATLLVLFKLLE